MTFFKKSIIITFVFICVIQIFPCFVKAENINIVKGNQLVNKGFSEIRSSDIQPRKMIPAFTEKMNEEGSKKSSQNNCNHNSETLIIKICFGWILGLIIAAFFIIPEWNYVSDWDIENSSSFSCKILRWLDKDITSK